MEPATPQEVQLNASVYLAALGDRLGGHLADLRAGLRSLDDGSYSSRAGEGPSSPLPRFVFETDIPGLADARRRLCGRCFVNVIGELVAFIDRMLAFSAVLGTQLILPPGSRSLDAIDGAVRQRIDEEYGKIATDTALSNPKKLSRFSAIDAFASRAALSYFATRRAIEHHGSRPAGRVTLLYARIRVLAGEMEMSRPDQLAPPNTGLAIEMAYEERELAAQQEIVLDEREIEHVVFTIQRLIAPEVARVASGLPSASA